MKSPLSLKTRKPSGRIAEVFDFNTHAVHQAQVQITERCLLAENNSAAGLQGSAAASNEKCGQVFMDMPVSIIEARAVNDHRIVEDAAVAFLHRGESCQPCRKVLGVVLIDPGDFGQGFLLAAVMGERVMA